MRIKIRRVRNVWHLLLRADSGPKNDENGNAPGICGEFCRELTVTDGPDFSKSLRTLVMRHIINDDPTFQDFLHIRLQVITPHHGPEEGWDDLFVLVERSKDFPGTDGRQRQTVFTFLLVILPGLLLTQVLFTKRMQDKHGSLTIGLHNLTLMRWFLSFCLGIVNYLSDVGANVRVGSIQEDCPWIHKVLLLCREGKDDRPNGESMFFLTLIPVRVLIRVGGVHFRLEQFANFQLTLNNT